MAAHSSRASEPPFAFDTCFALVRTGVMAVKYECKNIFIFRIEIFLYEEYNIDIRLLKE